MGAFDAGEHTFSPFFNIMPNCQHVTITGRQPARTILLLCCHFLHAATPDCHYCSDLGHHHMGRVQSPNTSMCIPTYNFEKGASQKRPTLPCFPETAMPSDTAAKGYENCTPPYVEVMPRGWLPPSMRAPLIVTGLHGARSSVPWVFVGKWNRNYRRAAAGSDYSAAKTTPYPSTTSQSQELF